MWHTQYGDRILKGKEAALFAELLQSLLQDCFLNDYDDCSVGIKTFDNLTYGQKISTLSTVANGLLREDVPIVPLTAVVEAAVAVVFVHLYTQLEMELDDPNPDTYWRQKVIDVRKEAEGEDLPAVDCEDMVQWDLQVQELESAILWDADYNDDDIYTDLSPEHADELRKVMGMKSDYYVSIADDLKDAEAEKIRDETIELCASVLRE